MWTDRLKLYKIVGCENLFVAGLFCIPAYDSGSGGANPHGVSIPRSLCFSKWEMSSFGRLQPLGPCFNGREFKPVFFASELYNNQRLFRYIIYHIKYG